VSGEAITIIAAEDSDVVRFVDAIARLPTELPEWVLIGGVSAGRDHGRSDRVEERLATSTRRQQQPGRGHVRHRRPTGTLRNDVCRRHRNRPGRRPACASPMDRANMQAGLRRRQALHRSEAQGFSTSQQSRSVAPRRSSHGSLSERPRQRGRRMKITVHPRTRAGEQVLSRGSRSLRYGASARTRNPSPEGVALMPRACAGMR
jgi:hypothetical protein